MALGGFGLGLANLGRIAGGLQQYNAQDVEIQRALAQLATEQRRQQLFDQQREERRGFFRALMDPSAGNVFGTPSTGAPGAVSGPDYSPGAVQATPLAPPTQPMQIPPVPSYQPSGGMPTDAQLDLARQAIARGYPPAAAAGIVGGLRGESGPNLDPYALNPKSGALGVSQWLGSRKTGLLSQPDPYSRATQERYMFDELRGPEAATGQQMMGETDPRQAARDFTAGFLRPGPGSTVVREDTAAKIYDQLDGAQQDQARRGAVNAATAVPPQFAGRLNLPQLAQLVNRTSPGASDEVKGAILGQILDIATPLAKMQFEQGWEQYKFQQEERDKAATRTETHEQHLAEQAHWRAMEAKGAAGKPPRFGTVDDLMQRWRDDFVQTQGRQPTTDEIAKQRADFGKEAKPMSATQAGIVRRLEFGTGEVAKALNSITQLPYGTTLGMFGGAQGAVGKQLLDNMRKSLANQVTPESAQVLRALTGGLSRGLGIIASGGVAQGLQNFSDQMGQLVPVAGDTGLTIAAKFADMRQLFDVATDIMLADDQIPDPQKELMKKLQDQVHKAVPFETADVARIVGDPDDQHLSDFAARMGLGSPAADAAPEMTQDQYNAAPSGTPYRVPGNPNVMTKP